MKTIVGAMVAAVGASVCCIGPVVFTALGAGALSAAAIKFEAYRPAFLMVTVALLGAGFYTTYRPSATASCATDGACQLSSRRVAKAALWLATILAILLEERMADTAPLMLLFGAVLEFKSDSPTDAVIAPDGRDGAYIGSGDGTVAGDRLTGTMSWSLYAGNCLYPLVRSGLPVPDDLHLCTLNPGGFIETEDGARIRFEGRGYGLRSPERYRVSATLAFSTEAAQYDWLTKLLAVMDGDFDEKAGRAIWHVHIPQSGSR